jgi:hypothetical protein
MIIDEHEVGAYIYQEGDFAIDRPRSVAAMFEVKTQLKSGDFDEALNNIASAKRLADNSDQICGLVFGSDGTNPSPSTLDNWFKRKPTTTLAKAPRLGPTLVSFFQHGALLLRLNFEKGATVDDGSNYHLVQHTSSINNLQEPLSEGWQLLFLLAMIYSACVGRALQRTHMPQDNKEVNELLMFSGGVPSADHFEFGRGFVSRTTS